MGGEHGEQAHPEPEGARSADPPKRRGRIFWTTIVLLPLIPLVAMAVLVTAYRRPPLRLRFCQQASTAASVASRLRSATVSDSYAAAQLEGVLGQLSEVQKVAGSDVELLQEVSSLRGVVARVLPDLQLDGSSTQAAMADIAALAASYDTSFCPG